MFPRIRQLVTSNFLYLRFREQSTKHYKKMDSKNELEGKKN